MNIKRNRIVEFFVNKVNHGLFMTVHADDNEDGDTPTVAPTVNYEELIKQARKEEKDKLYPRIEKAEKDSKETLVSLNNALLEKGALAQELEKLKGELKTANDKSEDSQLVKDLKKQVEDLTNELNELKSKGVDEAEIRKQIKAEYEIKLYIQEQINKNQDKILEAFDDTIAGTTKEEVDAAIKKAIEKSDSVKKSLGIDVKEEDSTEGEDSQKQQQNVIATPPVPKQKRQPPVANPANNGSKKTNLTSEDIRSMDVTSSEYAALRENLIKQGLLKK